MKLRYIFLTVGLFFAPALFSSQSNYAITIVNQIATCLEYKKLADGKDDIKRLQDQIVAKRMYMTDFFVRDNRKIIKSIQREDFGIGENDKKILWKLREKIVATYSLAQEDLEVVRRSFDSIDNKEQRIECIRYAKELFKYLDIKGLINKQKKLLSVLKKQRASFQQSKALAGVQYIKWLDTQKDTLSDYISIEKAYKKERIPIDEEKLCRYCIELKNIEKGYMKIKCIEEFREAIRQKQVNASSYYYGLKDLYSLYDKNSDKQKWQETIAYASCVDFFKTKILNQESSFSIITKIVDRFDENNGLSESRAFNSLKPNRKLKSGRTILDKEGLLYLNVIDYLYLGMKGRKRYIYYSNVPCDTFQKIAHQEKKLKKIFAACKNRYQDGEKVINVYFSFLVSTPLNHIIEDLKKMDKACLKIKTSDERKNEIASFFPDGIYPNLLTQAYSAIDQLYAQR